MAVIAGFMVPHPPMIVPAIGRGSEAQITETTEAYERVADEIAALRPETIVITSPHSIMYADYIHISPGSTAEGSFAGFGAPGVKFSEQYDTELVSEICRLADKEGLAAGTMGERDKKLDHGTMVPLWFIRNKYKGGKIVRIGLSGLDLMKHYRLGMIIRQACENTDTRAVFVASGDLSHKLQDYGPYGYAKEGPEYDERIMDVCSRTAFGELFDFSEGFCEKAAECGHRSFVIMAGAFDGLSVEAKALSHQDVTGVGYGICTFYPKGKDEDRHFLEQREKILLKELEEKKTSSDAYVDLARKTIEKNVLTGKRYEPGKDLPEEMLKNKAGVFVSIHEKGLLRGCIGTISATRSNIANEIVANAISACSRDPRFDPVSSDELKWLDISVDVLNEAEDIDSMDQLDTKRYGVIVSQGNRRGLLLPNLEGIDSVEEQVRIAARKGDIDLDEDYQLQRFEVVRHE
ncbi:MAG: AmmeMemoRadiSam system protein A, partial [Erysipelotrichaceae bacterium]|nr:AmmeMemoRadiSam system protein A [Erysipelotrichaceae bacterium]